MGELDYLQVLAPESAPEGVREAARGRLRAAMAAEVARPRARWARPVAVVAASALVAAAALAWVLLQAPPAAEAALERLATEVERIPAEAFPEGALLYTRSEQRSLVLLSSTDLPGIAVAEAAMVVPRTREVWIAPDGSTRLQITTGTPAFFDEATAEAYRRSGLPASFQIGTTVAQAFAPSADRIDPADWPTDPAQLEVELVAAAANLGPPEQPLATRLLGLAADLLRETGAQPDLRAAVLRVLARAEGLTVTTGAEPGVLQVTASYEDEAGTWSHTVAFDAEGNLIAETEVAVTGIPSAGVPPGTEIFQARYQPTAVIPEVPR
jgi:hypothetical protein